MSKYNSESWFKLDNSAVIYPMSITVTTQSLFRLTAEMKDYIDDECLLDALTKILPRFPAFGVVMRSGIFRHFFDYNYLPPVVRPDNGILFEKINFFSNNHYLFRVSYYKNKINIDYFHGLCDGYGAMEFLKALVYQYVIERGIEPPPANGAVKIAGEPVPEEELEDGFTKYYRPVDLFGGVIGEMAGKNAFALRGNRFRRAGYGLIQGTVPTEKLKEAAKRYNCTITAFLVASLLLSITEVHGNDTQKYNLAAMIPVNLRRFFPSPTLKNFTSLVKAFINPKAVPPTLQAYCDEVQRQLTDNLNAGSLQDKISLSSFMVSKWYMKLMPLFLKTFFVKLGKLLSSNTKQTLIVSNLGEINMPKGFEKYLNGFLFCLNVSRKVPKNVGIVSYNGKTVISFTRQLVSTRMEKQFFTRLIKEGVKVSVISNFREGHGV